MPWTTIPRWLYENDLPDDELQEVYVKAARLKVVQLREARDRERPRSREWRRLDGVLANAETFAEEAEAALAHYRGSAGEQGRERPPGRATVRVLPPPDDR
jgi:hypothetical protein